MRKNELIINNPETPVRARQQPLPCSCRVRAFAGVGWLAPVVGEHGLLAVVTGVAELEVRQRLRQHFPGCNETGTGATAAMEQLAEYLQGRRRGFSLPCDLSGLPPFTRSVLETLCRVPYGTTVSYGALARLVGRPGAARAVGGVMAHNRWPIVIPCHRVVGADGGMVGYSGGNGVTSKRWLLALEQRLAAGSGGGID